MVGRRRPRKGDRRIDAAIDHFAQMGYANADIRRTINQLLKVYGNDGWTFLEENGYHVVQEALIEKQEQEEQLQLQQQEEEETQKPELAMDEAPLENDMPILEVHNVLPAEAELAVKEVDPMLIDLPAPEVRLPLPAATATDSTRPPCYGWISESESEYESESDNEEKPASRQHEVLVPSPAGGCEAT